MKLTQLTEESKVEYLKPIQTEIGGLKIVVNDVGRDTNPFGNNPIAAISVDGHNYQAYKQGMINIWAFPLRDKLNRAEQQEFDDFLNKTFEEMQSMKD